MQALQAALANRNVQAFLRVIREGETSQTEDAYRTIVGGARFDSFADHPRQRVYIASLKVWSTAAGAYQFLSRTWDECAKALSLPDFSPASQDLAAVFLIRRRGALDDVIAGRLEDAIHKCRLEWASLPGSPYGQPTKTMARARAVYEQFGGTYALAPIVQPGPEPADYYAPSGEAPEWVPPPQEQTMILPALAKGLAAVVIEGFTPLVREKLTKEMGRHTDSPETASAVTDAVIGSVKAATGLTDPVQAVAAVRADPALMAKVEADSLARLEQALPLLERINDMESANVKSAREFNASEPFMVDTPWVKLRFVHLLSLMFVGFSGAFVIANWGSLTPELKGAVITLMVIAGWNGVRDYWMGSSSGSAAKDAVIGEITRRK